jgi:hypothetical protein
MTAKIYESPDGGRTVYKREIGNLGRELIKEDKALHNEIMENQLWSDIRQAAKNNPSIQEALDRVKITYYLSNEYEKKYGRKT